MTARLLFLTSDFPYGIRESFIEAEIAYVAAAFDEVIILPISAPGEARPVPQNVRVARPVIGSSKIVTYVLELLHWQTWKLLLQEMPKQIQIWGLRPTVIKRVFVYACHRAGLERHEAVLEAVERADSTTAYSYWGMWTGFALPLLHRHGVASCTRYHHADLYSDGNGAPWREEVPESADLCVFISEHGRKYFEENFRLLPGSYPRLIVSRLGAADNGRNPPRSDNNKFVLVSCSFIHSVKRVHLIARFAKALSKQIPVEWHHFGAGEDAALDREFVVPCDRLNAHLYGNVPLKQILDFYAANHVDLFANMSTSEGIPVSIIEAMSFGIKVLATDVGGTREAVIDGRSGLLVSAEDCEDSKALANRVIVEMEDGGLLARSDPRAVWAERFDPAKNFTAFAQTLAHLKKDVH